jgi:hypothetical protein
MDKDLKAKWIAALRSGKYEQGREYLRKDDSYCCLGVLCDLVDPNGWVYDSEFYSFHFNSDHDVDQWLPSSLPEKYGIDRESDLVDLNDTKQYDFNQIADWIEVSL